MKINLPEAKMTSEVSVGVGMPDSRKDHDDTHHNNVAEVLDNQTDPVLKRKMALMSEAIEQIGMTPFHWKLFVLTGFGYAVDSVGLDSSRLPGSF